MNGIGPRFGMIRRPGRWLLVAMVILLLGCEHLPVASERPPRTDDQTAEPGRASDVLLRSELEWFHRANLDQRVERYTALRESGAYGLCGQESLVMALVQSGRDPVPADDREMLIQAMEHCLDDEQAAIPAGMAQTLLNQLRLREAERQQRDDLRRELNEIRQREEMTSRQLQELRDIERSLRERGDSAN